MVEVDFIAGAEISPTVTCFAGMGSRQDLPLTPAAVYSLLT